MYTRVTHSLFTISSPTPALLLPLPPSLPLLKRFFVEFGASDGSECNTRYLREAGRGATKKTSVKLTPTPSNTPPNNDAGSGEWDGVLFDGEHSDSSINLHREWISAESIDALLLRHVPGGGVTRRRMERRARREKRERRAKGKQKEGGAERRERGGGTRGNPSTSAPAASAVGRPVFDLLSIDVDYNDYWVWRAIIDAGWRPRVVVVEVNAKIPWPESITVTYNATAEWDGTEYHGASMEAMRRLGRTAGYLMVHCESHGVNCFFVHDAALGFNPHADDADDADDADSADGSVEGGEGGEGGEKDEGGGGDEGGDTGTTERGDQEDAPTKERRDKWSGGEQAVRDTLHHSFGPQDLYRPPRYSGVEGWSHPEDPLGRPWVQVGQSGRPAL